MYPPRDLATMVTNINVKYDNQVWYIDNEANVYITFIASKLTTQQPFCEFDFVTVINGLGLQIQKHLLFIL
jgi:hypothetical protein